MRNMQQVSIYEESIRSPTSHISLKRTVNGTYNAQDTMKGYAEIHFHL